MTRLNTPARRASVSPAPATVVLLLAGAMWAAEIADTILPVNADAWGIDARTVPGLIGIPLAPFLHAGFSHLMANTWPFLLMGMLVAWRAPAMLWPILLVVTVVGGFGVWVLSPSGVITIGASGVIFGLLGYLLAAGVISRRAVDILLSLGVLLVYGSMLAGATPFGVPAGVSWLAHLTGLAAGVLAAVWFAPRPVRRS